MALWTFDRDLSESFSQSKSHSALAVKLVDGKVGSGLLLSEENTSNLIVADGTGPVDLDDPFTVSFWARWENENGVLLSQTGRRANLTIKLQSGDLKVELVGSGLTLYASLRRDLPLNTWRHITIKFNGSPDDKGLEVLLDGKTRTKPVNQIYPPENVGRPLRIDSSKTQMHFGCNPFAEYPQYGSHATIDEVRVYDRELTADEIVQVKSYGLK